MSEKLSHKDRTKQIKEEEKYETIKTLFTLSFVITDSLMIFDLVANAIVKEIEQYFYLRFFVTFFGLYGTLILIGGYYFMEYCDCDCTCNCSELLTPLFSFCGCHLLFGGLLLIISYCVELCSIKYYFSNKEKINDSLVVFMIYLLFASSTITVILFIVLLINSKNERKIKQKID